MKTKSETTKKLNSLIALGTGTSTGIPMIGCQCLVCTSIDSRDKRLRTSIYIESSRGKKILVDTTPDLRTQFLNNKISAVDFVIMTHDHADHLHGIDDLRPMTFGAPSKSIPIYCNSVTKKRIEERFSYIFNKDEYKDRPILGGGIPKLNLKEVELEKEIIIEGESLLFFNYPHGHGQTMGFIHENMAYIVDCMELPLPIINLLKKNHIELLILDCLQRGTHSTHLTVEKSFAVIKELKPKRCGLIHMGHDLSHQTLTEEIKRHKLNNVIPLYDQLQLRY